MKKKMSICQRHTARFERKRPPLIPGVNYNTSCIKNCNRKPSQLLNTTISCWKNLLASHARELRAWNLEGLAHLFPKSSKHAFLYVLP